MERLKAGKKRREQESAATAGTSAAAATGKASGFVFNTGRETAPLVNDADTVALEKGRHARPAQDETPAARRDMNTVDFSSIGGGGGGGYEGKYSHKGGGCGGAKAGANRRHKQPSKNVNDDAKGGTLGERTEMSSCRRASEFAN